MHRHLPFAYWLVQSFLLQCYLLAYYKLSTVLCHVLCKSAPAVFWFQTLNLSDSPFLPKAIFLNLAWWMASCWEQFPCSEPNSFCPSLGEERWHFSLWDIILILKGMWELDKKRQWEGAIWVNQYCILYEYFGVLHTASTLCNTIGARIVISEIISMNHWWGVFVCFLKNYRSNLCQTQIKNYNL